VSGARTQFNGDTATLMVENGRSGSLWAQVTIIQSKNYVIAKRDDASQTLNTDWVEWNRLDEDQQYRGRYQISVKPQGYQQAVVVKLVNLEQAGKPVADPASLQRYSTAMLNVISEGLDMNATSAQNAARSAGRPSTCRALPMIPACRCWLFARRLTWCGSVCRARWKKWA
jgi:outer membrane protein assembly factor BamC